MRFFVSLCIFCVVLFAEEIMRNPLSSPQKNTSSFNSNAVPQQILADSKHRDSRLRQKQRITLDFLRNQRKGIVRDFYIWLFLKQDISKADADAAHKLVHRQNTQLFGLYYKKGSNQTLGRKTICERMTLKDLLRQDAKCISYALTLKDAATLPKGELASLSRKVKKVNPELSQQLGILAARNPIQALLNADPAIFASVFDGVPLDYRLKQFEAKIPANKINHLANQKSKKFWRLLRVIIMNPQYPKLQASIAEVNNITAPDAITLFYLGLNAFKHQRKQAALTYLERSAKKSQDPIMRDRINFWFYMITQNVEYLQKVSRSGYPNIYSLYATEKLNVAPAFRIVYDILPPNVKVKNTQWDITDPFEWLNMQERIRAGEDSLKRIKATLQTKETEPHLALALRRENQFRIHYYIRPYRELFERYSQDKQALLYAISLQESFFIPASVSISYALGMMQIMPFNVESIAKKLNETRYYTDMFDPAINIKYAEFLLRDLEQEFKEPLFIAYAYNGGSGFARRILKQPIFSKKNPLDPWWSMEFVPYEESRNYGQKVMTNYIIYQRLLGKNITTQEALQRLLR
ncbi:hypothetical protein CCZ01_02385 [Helicobacter monodelphidis]|uniref:lytic transglycosylase domain-containing protein n=1 Tax=Helicobacter sp. 15-1451 TaxID=2004995 RepID=UPI000DCB13D6|nr:lytic transglycosylase domain-containing protein [Helicobacter sp. 15-1451]RAX58649.1 hypothetical protein CCZ01_02385 [Helicobacter sp. 15-1451]